MILGPGVVSRLKSLSEGLVAPVVVSITRYVGLLVSFRLSPLHFLKAGPVLQLLSGFKCFPPSCVFAVV